MEYIAFDVHKHYTWAVVEDERGWIKREGKILHARGSLREFLKGCEPGSSRSGDGGELVLDR